MKAKSVIATAVSTALPIAGTLAAIADIICAGSWGPRRTTRATATGTRTATFSWNEATRPTSSFVCSVSGARGRKEKDADRGERRGAHHQHGQTPLESPPFQPPNDRFERDGEGERDEYHHHDGPDLQPGPDERRRAQDLQDGQPGHVKPNAFGR